MRRTISILLLLGLLGLLAFSAAAQDSVTIGYGAPELSGGQGVIMSGLGQRGGSQGLGGHRLQRQL